MSRVSVGVLRGGPSSEYDISLETGAAVLDNLPEEKYAAVDVFIDRGGVWHVRGRPSTPTRVLNQVDVVFNALHGQYGEDGQAQRILEQHGIPFTGSSSSSCALCMNKITAKGSLPEGVYTAPHVYTHAREPLEEVAQRATRTLGTELVVKPVGAGSSVGVSIVHTPEEIAPAVEKALAFGRKVLIEKQIVGREATCGVIDGFRGESPYALLPVEIVPTEGHSFFDYEAKYRGKSQELCPGRFSRRESEELQRLASTIHRTLGLRHYSRSDFIITHEGICFLEINTLPGLTDGSLLPKELAAVGATLPEFLDHIIQLALRRK